MAAKVNVRDRNKNKPDKKPNWEYRFEAAKIDGKRKHISKAGFRTKKEALEAGAKALIEYNNSGVKVERVETSIHDYLDYWFEQYVEVNLAYNSQLAYRRIIDNHLKPRFGIYKLTALTPAVIQEYVNDLKAKKYSKSFIKGNLSILSAAMDYAIVPLQYIKDNPVRLVKIPKLDVKPKAKTILTLKEWKEIESRFPFGNRFYIPLLIGFHTGLRISESFALTWDDINLETKELTVNKQVVFKDKSWYFAPPKSESSNRTVTFGETLATALKKEKSRQIENELLYGEHYTIQVIKIEVDEKGKKRQKICSMQKNVNESLPRTRLISINENGEYTSNHAFKYAARTITHELHIDFSYHCLRHTHATLLIENGANIKNVQKRLGHERIETTLQTYVHDTEVMDERSVEIFENLVHQVK